MNAEEIGRVLDEIATLLELKGENPFRVRAYQNAAQALRGLTEEIGAVIAEGRLREIRGIGPDLADRITKLATTGKLDAYDQLKAEVPPGLLEMVQLPGLGPKRVKAIHDALGVATIGELEYACRENRLAKLEGFGQKSQQKVLDAIEHRRRYSDRHLYHHARAAADAVTEVLGAQPGLIRAEVAGSLRRNRETIGDIDVVASADAEARDAIMAAFVGMPEVAEVIEHGDTRSRVGLESGINVDLRLVADRQYPYALAYFTGSKQHNIVLRQRAIDRRLRLNEYGLFRVGKDSAEAEAGDLVECRDEEELYRALDLAYIPPELREDMGEFDAAEKGTLPRLVEPADIKGILHVHTDASDGANTLEQMAAAAQAMGASYLGICDHSQSAAYAGGLTPDRVRRQWDQIDRLNELLDGLVVLKGIESDIRGDGSLDYDDALMRGFDFVIASIHSKLKMTEDEATRRILTALDHPAVTILGHPTGRLLLAREGYPLDMQAVIDRAAERGVAIELNASPHRLDLDWTWCRKARAKGVRIAINPDAHAVRELAVTEIGVAVGRKGWLEAADVLNALPYDEFRAAIRRRG